MSHQYKYNGPKILKKKEEMGLDKIYYIQEKIDGSQLTFTIEDSGELVFACRGKPINKDVKQFHKAVHMIEYMKNKFNPNYIYHGECVTSNKHNIITYHRMPLFNFIVYDIYDKTTGEFLWYDDMEDECKRIGYEHVPILYVGEGKYYEITTGLLRKDKQELESHLGGQIEGVVIKFKERGQQKGSYKHVIESFREQKQDGENINNMMMSCNTTDDYIMQLGSLFATDARFLKAVQHIQEEGLELSRENMRHELDKDFDKEYKDTIKELLWTEFSHDLKKYAKEGYTNHC